MNKAASSAESLARSVLGEAYQGPEAAVLLKYRLLDPATNEIVKTTLPGDTEPGWKLNPDVVARFLELDSSRAKRAFEWMIYASGGGEPHLRESENAYKLAKDWIIERRMKGIGPDDEAVKPMSREEAEASWEANEAQRYRDAYFFADQELASDRQYPVFGWYRAWPGRHDVYKKVVDGMQRLLDVLRDRKLLAQWNKVNPNNKLLTDLGQLFWDGDTPKFKDADALIEFVSTIRTTLARQRAEKDVRFVGRAPVEQGGGYRYGPDEVLYDDNWLTMYFPLNAGAALKSGHNDWCVANRTRWNDYFKKRDRRELYWGSYNERGPFAFIHFKVRLDDTDLQTLAAHIQTNAAPGGAERIEWWDRANRAQVPRAELYQRLRKALPPEGMRSFQNAMKALEEWMQEFSGEELERYPALEATAQALVNSLLA